MAADTPFLQFNEFEAEQQNKDELHHQYQYDKKMRHLTLLFDICVIVTTAIDVVLRLLEVNHWK